jgi:hypothetical protein
MRLNHNKTIKQKSNILITCEGLGDKKFIGHIKELLKEDIKTKIILKNYNGGSISNIIDNTRKEYIKNSTDYNKILILVDIDRKDDLNNITNKDIETKIKNFLKNKKLSLIYSKPYCIEGMILKLTNQYKNSINSSQNCKEEFKKIYNKELTKMNIIDDFKKLKLNKNIFKNSKIDTIEKLINTLIN